MFEKVNPKQNFFALEQDILNWWKENDILNKSINQRPNDKQKTFYDGPITANGMPHHGHMLTFAMKDVVPRLWTMQGYKVARSLGWDNQGIPVEYEIEKKLGFKEKKDIEKFGIAKFNELCRQSVLEYEGKIIDLEEKMGRLTNKDEEYHTMDAKYIESIWWSLKELFTKGLLYEGFKVVPYSTRAGTTLSNAEVALGGYKKLVDPAITVEFPLVENQNLALLAWTTTPWTMPGNLGLAVGKDINYVEVKGEGLKRNYIVAKDLVEKVFAVVNYEIVRELKGEELVGKEYIPPFDFYKGWANAHKIYEGFHVTTEDGTGIVHLAPYGAEDNEIFQQVGIKSFDYLDDQGDFTSEIAPYAGINYRTANPQIIKDLESKGVLFKSEDYEHDMPMCWRTNTPLIYKPIKSWYVAMSTLRTNLVENNEKINWTPEHVKHGRFGNWLAEIKDWGISRSRYWGTPLPIWKSESGKTLVIGSFEELKKYSGVTVEDPHRPFIDEVTFEFEGEKYTRIKDVLDVWYDSGAMPFARLHYPFENKDLFLQKFPAQYIAESVDQTRGWFYSLLAISTALFGKEAYENVVMSGFVLDDNGVKLSKSKGNYTAPDKMIEDFGADSIRLNFFSTPICAGEDTTITPRTLKIITQEYILPLWNIYSYLVTYANIHNWEPGNELAYNERKVENDEHPWDHMPFDNLTQELDSWILLRLQKTIKEVTQRMGKYEITNATKAIKELIDDTSKWYIRSNRARFAEGDKSALDILYYVIVETLKLLAPFAPFVSEHIYRKLVVNWIDESKESIHLTDFPVADEAYLSEYEALDYEMQFVRSIVELGHSLRTTSQIKVRQPLGRLEVYTQNQKVPALSEWMRELLQNELNIKEVLDVPKMDQQEGYVYTEDSSINVKVGLNTVIDQTLVEEGRVREVSRLIQSKRKSQGFNQGDKVNVEVSTSSDDIKNLFNNKSNEIMSNVNAQKISIVENLEGEEDQIDGMMLKIKISK